MSSEALWTEATLNPATWPQIKRGSFVLFEIRAPRSRDTVYRMFDRIGIARNYARMGRLVRWTKWPRSTARLETSP